jgi:CRISPR-associated RAMP protein (TIGR02581 family)
MAESMNRYELRNRYVFTGKLVMLTAFHIGGGRVTLSSSDSPVVLTPEQIPFIPGSSFKGALRSTVEKLVPSLPDEAGLSSCGLIEPLKDDGEQKTDKPLCPTIRQRAITQERRDNPGTVDEIRSEVLKQLCNTCLLFGSPFAASRVNINDLYMPSEEWSGVVQIRDGVAIDRDSEKAKDRLKYDFEVVPASAVFNLTITLENATNEDLQLLSMGLSEFVHGFGFIGGKRSRGLGACRLDDLHVSALELKGSDGKEIVEVRERNRRLSNYLLKREFSSEEAGEAFLERHINEIFAKVSL